MKDCGGSQRVVCKSGCKHSENRKLKCLSLFVSRYLASHLFDVSGQSTMEQVALKEEITIPWGKGIVGHVAESGKSVNIPDCYKVSVFVYLLTQFNYQQSEMYQTGG